MYQTSSFSHKKIVVCNFQQTEKISIVLSRVSIRVKSVSQFAALDNNLVSRMVVAVSNFKVWSALQYNPRFTNRICTLSQHIRFCGLLSATLSLETVQEFLIKLDIKPLMHLLKISIFSLNNDILRLAKIMNNLVKDCKICTFKVIFQCLKLVESFKKKDSVKNI